MAETWPDWPNNGGRSAILVWNILREQELLNFRK